MITININGRKVELPDDLAQQLIENYGVPQKTLADTAAGDTVKIGNFEMIVLEQFADGTTALLRKDALKQMAFGKDNNYNGSDADKVCNAFAEELAGIVGEENIVLHEVDLTADDGLKGYGKIQRKASLRTANMQRKYVEILDKYRLDIWEWLATAFSIPPHDEDNWVKCVSPSGYFYFLSYDFYFFGVRPFCILKSNIFVSE